MLTKIIQKLSFVLTVIASSATVSFGCSLIIPPVVKADLSQYLFIGKVSEIKEREYLSKDYSFDTTSQKYIEENKLRIAYGVNVQVLKKLNLPKSFTSVDIFPLHLRADCGDSGWNKDELLKEFPVGSTIAIRAREGRFLSDKSNANDFILEITVGSGDITKVADKTDSSTLVKSSFNYKSLAENQITNLTWFELEKDLLRLEFAKSEIIRIKILERLLYYPRPFGLDFKKIVQREITRDTEKKRVLIRKWKIRETNLLKKISKR